MKCDRCQKLYRTGEVEFIPNGNERWWRVDARPVSYPYHHQATHSRIGWERTRRVGCEDGERVCYRCRGVAAPEPTKSVARQAREAWADAIRENPELARFAPRSVREGR